MTPFQRIVSEKQRLIWPLVVVLAANIALYAMLVYPLSQKVAVGEQDANAAGAALGAARRDYATARATVSGKGQADTELAKFYQEVLPPDLSGARRITYLPIEQLAEASNLRVQRGTSDPSVVRDSTLHKLTRTAVLTGEYRNIRRFLHRLETAPEFLIVENVSLTQNENDASRGIQLMVQVATYYRSGGDGN